MANTEHNNGEWKISLTQEEAHRLYLVCLRAGDLQISLGLEVIFMFTDEERAIVDELRVILPMNP